MDAEGSLIYVIKRHRANTNKRKENFRERDISVCNFHYYELFTYSHLYNNAKFLIGLQNIFLTIIRITMLQLDKM